MIPKFKIGVRTADGLSHVFAIQHEAVNTIEQVTALTFNEIAEAKVILVLVPNTKQENQNADQTDALENGTKA